MRLEDLAPLVRGVLEKAGLAAREPEAAFHETIGIVRTRYATLNDFATKGRPYFAADFAMEAAAEEKLNAPQARELLHELAGRLAANREFSEQSVEADLRALASERGVKAGVLINGSRAALTGQAAGPSAFAVFMAVGRERVLERLRRV
jgi:glutamyl-tRNA synthetase